MPSRGVISEIGQGLSAPLRGLRFLLANPSLRRLALVPLAINAVLFAVAIAVFVSLFDAILAAATGFLTVAAGAGVAHFLLAALAMIAKAVVGVAIVLAFAAAVFFGFTLIGGLIAAPFNEVLSQRTEALQLAALGLGPKAGSPPGATGLAGIWREASYAFSAELRRTCFYLLVMAGLASLNLVPGGGTLAFTLLGTLASCYFFAWDHTDMAMSRRRLSFAEKRKLLAEHRGAAFAFGAIAVAITAVPVLNLLMLPVQVVAGTLLFLEWTQAPATTPSTTGARP